MNIKRTHTLIFFGKLLEEVRVTELMVAVVVVLPAAAAILQHITRRSLGKVGRKGRKGEKHRESFFI
jgi:hypothetical protein